MDQGNTNRPPPQPDGIERRRLPRFDCDGQVEINRIPSTGKRQGKLRDLSMSGCFVETSDPFAAPSYVEIVIHTKTMTLIVAGTVRRTLKSGMGIEFNRISATGRHLLEELIRDLEQSEHSR